MSENKGGNADDDSNTPSYPTWFTEPPFNVTSTIPATHTASCYCGSIQFTTSSDPITSKLCDCTECQRLHAAPYQWAALFFKSQIRFSEQSYKHLRFFDTASKTFAEDGSQRSLPTKLQCRRCGTWIADEGRRMFMTFPTLFHFDDSIIPSSFFPTCRIFSSTAVSVPSQRRRSSSGHPLLRFDSLPRFVDDLRTPVSVSDFLQYIARPLRDGGGGGGGCTGILGGRVHFTQSPLFAALATLKLGAEVSYLVTSDEAALTMNDCPPEIRLVLGWSSFELHAKPETLQKFDDLIHGDLFPRLKALCIGPGLGWDARILTSAICCRRGAETKIPLVIDSTALWMMMDSDETEAIHFIWKRPQHQQQQQQHDDDTTSDKRMQQQPVVVITPNQNDFQHLLEHCSISEQKKQSEDQLLLRLTSYLKDNVVVLKKGAVNKVARPGSDTVLTCTIPGCDSSPGYVGDLLVGCVTALLGWTCEKYCSVRQKEKLMDVVMHACVAACTIVQCASTRAFEKKMDVKVGDMLEELGAALEDVLNHKYELTH